MKGSTVHWNAWGQYFAIAAAYEAVYEITYHLSSSQFLLTTGLRLAVMLLLPMRFWLALAIGEAVPLVENAFFSVGKFGYAWTVLATVPTVALWWLPLKSIRTRWPLLNKEGTVRMHVFLGAALAVSAITSAIMTMTWGAAMIERPGMWPARNPIEVFFTCLIGAYLGALTLTPVILALRERARNHWAAFSLGAIWRSPLLRDIVWWALPTLMILAWVASTTQDDSVRNMVRYAFLWPALGLTWRHGWHGTAVAGLMASFALAYTAHGHLGREALASEICLAVVLSVALFSGARSHRGIGVTARANAP
ncbi:hypothetical protein KR767_00185 [Luteibacter anthropi]|uniref:hypothetical protein n=1 Tax=Luteibacter anthropi TaxID=564369 RepID=UPI0020324B5E|nr:hypothetical protein [Luteibacter anthropi]URX62554.1 hypothetical protein KR767_00185 [Luteibacter anthropi]